MRCISVTGAALLALATVVGLARAQAEDWRISTAGYGPARLGMSVDEAAKALGIGLKEDPAFDSPECNYLIQTPEVPGLFIMASRGRVVRFEIHAPSTATTRSGLAIGDPEQRVLDVLGPDVVVEPHHYTGPDDHYLTLWSDDETSGVRFETYQGKVIRFYAGRNPEVTFIEGCS